MERLARHCIIPSEYIVLRYKLTLSKEAARREMRAARAFFFLAFVLLMQPAWGQQVGPELLDGREQSKAQVERTVAVRSLSLGLSLPAPAGQRAAYAREAIKAQAAMIGVAARKQGAQAVKAKIETEGRRWGVAAGIRNLSSEPPAPSSSHNELTPGQPVRFRAGPVVVPTLFVGDGSFRLEVPDNASRVTFTLNSDNSAVDVDLFVRFGEDNYLRNGRVVTDHSSTGDSGNEEIVIDRSSDPPLRAGTYFVSLALFDTGVAAAGTLTATVETGGGGTPTDDHGDTPAEATALSAGSSVQGRIETGGDVDYFRLQIPAESDVEIYTTGSLDTVGSLHNSSNARIAGNDDGGTSLNFRIARRLAAGVYYIAVRSFRSGTGSYTLHASVTGGGQETPPAAGGTITTVAGDGRRGYFGDGVPAAQAQLDTPWGVAVDGSGNLYIADRDNHRIRKVDAAGVITTVAGNGAEGYGGDGGPAAQARLYLPQGVAADGSGNLYIADRHNHRIRKVDAAGVITTVAGNGAEGYGGDGGPAAQARLYLPHGVAVDGSGNLYIADSFNHRIRKVDAAGVITTVAGDGTRGYGGDGGLAAQARLDFPYGVAVDGSGNLYIADGDNNRIRKVDAAGVITTVAGDGTYGYGGDGGPAAQAQLSVPYGVAVDGVGNLYIADTFSHRIRKVESDIPVGMPLISSGGVLLATGAPTVARISPNTLVSVFGREFAPAGTQASSPRLDASGRIAAELAATCLEIGGKRAPLFAVFPNQINAQAPHDLTPGQTRVEVIRGCGAGEERRSSAATVAVGAVSPAFFNFAGNPEGINPVVALHGGGPALVGAPGSIPGVDLTPADPGEYVTLFGTGFGETAPRLEAGQIPGGQVPLANAVEFAFGGIAVPPEDVFYAGASPCCAGLYQFTVRVPPDIPGGAASVSATLGGVSTPQGPFLVVRGGSVPPPPAPTVTLSASPASIERGESATLRWSSTNATSAEIDRGIGAVSVSGSRRVSPTSTTTYRITVRSSDGRTASDTARVTVTAPPPAPTVTLSASPASIERGESATLRWSSTNATSAEIDRGIGAVSVSGSRRVSPTSTTTYRITVRSSDGRTASDTARVTVTAPPPAPTVTLSASPASIERGGSATLRWSSTNATSAEIDRGIGAVSVSGSRRVSPTSTTTYRITVRSSDGRTASDTARVTVTAPPPPSSGICRPDTIVAPGGSCRIQTSNGINAATFTVREDGFGCVAFICAGRGLSLTNLTVNGFRITFHASRNANGTWTISRVEAQ